MNPKNQSKIAAFVLAVGLVFTLLGCHGRPAFSHKAEDAGNANAAATLEGFAPSLHFQERLRERGISVAQAADVLKNGQRYYDPKHDSYIRWKGSIYVALTPNGVLKTIIRGPLESRWRPQ